MEALLNRRTGLMAAIVALIAVAMLAAACGGGIDDAVDAADGVTAAEVATEMEGMETNDAAVAEIGEADQDGGAHADEAVVEHDEAIDEHDEAVDDHDDEANAHEQAAHEETDGLDENEARTITVVATDFAYGTAEVQVTVGETIRLVLVNEGTVLHDITAAGFIGDAGAVNTAEHAHMEGMAGMDFHTAAETGETTELLFVAEEAGRFKLFCTVPGHEQLGMTAVLVVEEA